MYTTYILRDDDGKLYKGVTNDLKRRFKEHASGHTRTTARMKSFRVIYTEEYETFAEARKRELYLKSSAGRRFLNNVLP